MVLRSEDVNYLVYRYLKESGFLHSSYIFQFESQIHKATSEQPNVEPGSLIRVLQKGLQYMDVETHLNEDGTARLCTAPFSLVGKHVCSVKPTETSKSNKVRTTADSKRVVASEDTSGNAHGGHTLVHDTNSKARKYAKSRDSSVSGEVAFAAATNAVVAGTSGGNDSRSPADEDESMDVDVPDTEREASRALEGAKNSSNSGRKARLVDRALILRGHTAPVFLCEWNPSSPNSLATGAGDGTARIWDLSKAKADDHPIVLKHQTPLSTTGGNDARADVTSISWNPQGTLLATASFSGQLCIWSAAGELKMTLKHRQVPVVSMRWNRKGLLLLSACLDGTIALWDTVSGTLRHEYKGHVGSVMDVDWQDNTTFASCAADRLIMIWRDGDPSPIRTLAGHKSDVNAIKWHPSGKYLASASDDGTLKIWSPNSDSPVQDFFGHSQQVYSIRWLPRPEKAIIASASFDGTARVWDVHSNSCLRVLSAHTEAVHCLAFSSDGRYLATGSFDKRVRIWNIKDGSLFKTFIADDGIHDVQWASKGRIAVAIANSQVAIFDPLST
ncbi:hypothetical protein J3B02_003449 [Coemansia erecta]|uniref:Anaphase-promoting complex subunit 4-like WD40 domain-containing protein n=1 Tax=Coemansia asiatica TaxID=1052880 RepID=A0A9W8CIT3_9FUNG|nr:hypothetical protein LPJ64_004755 [Coemansia asiatica]KAJ2852638.1 hypothetical protein J3B02_003449 [Coemansia erecta]KAJ2879151.1 hypothetical protein FB639_003162 [Coemansia asiatica]